MHAIVLMSSPNARVDFTRINHCWGYFILMTTSVWLQPKEEKGKRKKLKDAENLKLKPQKIVLIIIYIYIT